MSITTDCAGCCSPPSWPVPVITARSQSKDFSCSFLFQGYLPGSTHYYGTRAIHTKKDYVYYEHGEDGYPFDTHCDEVFLEKVTIKANDDGDIVCTRVEDGDFCFAASSDIPVATDYHKEFTEHHAFVDGDQDILNDWHLSDEVLESTIIPLLLANLNAEGPGTPTSFRSWQGNMGAVKKAKFRIEHLPPGTCYLKVWLRQTFTADAGGEPIVTELTPYEWTGPAGTPCADPTVTILGDYIDIEVPATAGTNEVTMRAYSFHPDYDPTAADPQGPNGLPGL